MEDLTNTYTPIWRSIARALRGSPIKSCFLVVCLVLAGIDLWEWLSPLPAREVWHSLPSFLRFYGDGTALLVIAAGLGVKIFRRRREPARCGVPQAGCNLERRERS